MPIEIKLTFDNYEEAVIALGAVAEEQDRQRKAKGKGVTTVAGAVAAQAGAALTAKAPGKAAQKLMDEFGVSLGEVTGTGKDGAITKGDVMAVVEARKAAVTSPAEQSEDDNEPELPPGEPVAQIPPSIADCTAALRDVMAKHNADACREVLAEFNVARISELAEDKRAAFILSCNGRAA